jgi:hypothetical protein
VPPRLPSRPAPEGFLALQRGAGNAAVARMLEGDQSPQVARPGERCACGGVIGADGLCARCRRAAAGVGRVALSEGGPVRLHRVPKAYDAIEQTKLIEEAIRDKDIGKVKSVEDSAYALATDSQAIDMILILLNQGWVGPRDESAIYEIWKSRTGLIALASKYAYVWNMCLDRGVDIIWSIPELLSVKNEFKRAVAARARGYLASNRKVVDAELKRYGLDDMNAAPAPQQAAEREKLMSASVAVKKASDALKKMERMLVAFDQVVDTPQASSAGRYAAVFDPAGPPPRPGREPMPLPEGEPLPSWEDAKKNYDRANGLIDHYTRLFPALVALRDEHDLGEVARGGASSEEAANSLMAMQVMRRTLDDTLGNIDKTHKLVDDVKGDFALELQPIHEQFFLSDPGWSDPFKQLVARRAIKEHDNVKFWESIGVGAIGAAMFVVAELSTGGLATFFFAAAASGSIAQAAASWDRYFELKAASATHMSKETALITREQASDQMLTAALDTVLAFVDAYVAAKGGAKALARAGDAEARLAGAAGKEAAGFADELRAAHVDVGGGHEVKATERGLERCSPGPCPLIDTFWENSLERHPELKARIEADSRKARTDPVWAARDAGSADRALQNVTALEFEQWAASIPAMAEAGELKFTKTKRLPKHRADIANRPLTAEERAMVERNAAEMKVDGRLPPDWEYRPPDIPGAVIPAGMADDAMKIIGTLVTADAEVAACWRDAAQAALRDSAEPLSKDNYEALYKSAQGRFWNRVGGNAGAKRFFEQYGYTVDGTRAAYLKVEGVAAHEVSVGLDHMLPKAAEGTDNWRYALDGDKLQFLMQADNTKLSHLEKKDPSLRRK